MHIVILTAVGVGGATVAGALFGFVFRNSTKKFSNIILAVASGVMLATSILNLIVPSLEYKGSFSLFFTVSGVLCGSLCVRFLQSTVNKISNKRQLKTGYNNKNLNHVLVFIIAIAIHNLPEGIAAGVGFGTENISDALTIAGSIALQNIPEGMVVVAPMISVGISPSKTFLIAVFTGIIEVIGTFSGYFAVTVSERILPFALAFAGGTMINVICNEMLPEIFNNSDKKSYDFPLIAGFCFMLIIDALI